MLTFYAINLKFPVPLNLGACYAQTAFQLQVIGREKSTYDSSFTEDFF